jgi:hypothetical protein
MFIPDTYKLFYQLDEVKKTFAQFKLHHAEKPLLTDLIRLEKNNGYNLIKGADNLLAIRNATNWVKCSRAGLRPTGTPNFYYSDLPENGVKSLIVVFIPDDTERIEIRVCKQFYPKGNPDYRKRLVNHLIINF